MSTNAMDDLSDGDMLEMGVKRRRGFSWPVVLLVLTIVAAAGFVVSFHVPLVRAHAQLNTEYNTLAPKARELDDALKATQEELKKVDQQRQELQDQEDARARARDAGKDAFKDLKTTLSNDLAKPMFKKQVSVLYGPTRLRVRFKDGIFKPNSLDLTPAATKDLLCKAASAIQKKSGLNVAVVGHTSSGKAPSAALAKDYDDAWAYSGAAAGVVAGALVADCGFPSSRLVARGAANTEEKAGDGVTLEVTVAEKSE